MSPTLMSLYFSKPMPHSNPALTSRHVVLEAAQRANLPFVDHRVVTQQPRLGVARAGDAPFGTMQPAIVPNFGDLEDVAHLGGADPHFPNVGSSSPAMAFFISSVTL